MQTRTLHLWRIKPTGMAKVTQRETKLKASLTHNFLNVTTIYTLSGFLSWKLEIQCLAHNNCPHPFPYPFNCCCHFPFLALPPSHPHSLSSSPPPICCSARGYKVISEV